LTSHSWKAALILALLALMVGVAPATAQDDDDEVIPPAQPDFTLSVLPTGMRVPLHKSAFRVTHRFLRPLGDGDFGDLLGDAFGLDSGAQIGLEFRYGLIRGTQVGFYRTSDKTIQLFTEHSLFRQREGMPLAVTVWGSIEGTNNFKDSYSPALGGVIARLVGQYAAFYFEPIWVNNSNLEPSELVDHNDTFILGIGTRLRVRPTVYVVGEWIPRVSGNDPGVDHGTVGIEKRIGGHVFQLNFSNSFGTTMGQIARGGFNNDNWYLGFNISRKFY
jgi:Membrane bound beta barrel domain (DUF5777)